ncbi:MAG: hypothetical protein AAFY41_03040 [Bacteroidota bacterium]
MLTSLMMLVIISCDENEDLLAFEEADNKITFPDHPAFSATFTSLDEVILDIAVEGGTTSLEVEGRVDTDDDDNPVNLVDYGTVAISGGEGNFTSTIANLQLESPNSVEMAFSDGDTERLFSLSIANPATIESTTSTEVNLDSIFSVVFSAESENGVIDSYDVFLKNGEQSTYSTTPNAEGTGTTTELMDSLTFTASRANYAIGDTVFFRVDFNSGSLTASASGTVLVKGVALTESDDITLRTPDYAISSGVTDSLLNAYNLKAFKHISDELLTTSPDSADIQLAVNGGELEITTGTGSGTSFVVAGSTFSFAKATYESVKAAFDAGTSTTTVGDIESLDDGTVLLIELGSIPQSGAPAADNRRYAVVQVGEISKADGGVTSEVTLSYKASAQPE